jgi:hypothetical protein
MKVLDLCCAHEHRFEGWFASDSSQVHRLPSAPRLNVLQLREPLSKELAVPQRQAQTELLNAVREFIQTTEDVGERFADEARRIHYGESEERSIRGQASNREAQDLREEGIEVFAMLLPAALKGPVQ